LVGAGSKSAPGAALSRLAAVELLPPPQEVVSRELGDFLLLPVFHARDRDYSHSESARD
jgi:hypothetical protein